VLVFDELASIAVKTLVGTKNSSRDRHDENM